MSIRDIGESIKDLWKEILELLRKFKQRIHTLPNYADIEDTLQNMESQLYELSQSRTEDTTILNEIRELKNVLERANAMTDEELIAEKDHLLQKLTDISDNLKNGTIKEYTNLEKFVKDEIEDPSKSEVYTSAESGTFLSVAKEDGTTAFYNIMLVEDAEKGGKDGYALKFQPVEALPEDAIAAPNPPLKENEKERDHLMSRISLGVEQVSNVVIRRKINQIEKQQKFRAKFEATEYANDDTTNSHYQFDKETNTFSYLDKETNSLVVFAPNANGNFVATLYKDCEDFSHEGKKSMNLMCLQPKDNRFVCTVDFGADPMIDKVLDSPEIHDYIRYCGIDPKILNREGFSRKINYLENDAALKNAKMIWEYLKSKYPSGKDIFFTHDPKAQMTYISIHNKNGKEDPIFIDFHKDDGTPKEIFYGSTPVRDLEKNYKGEFVENKTIQDLYCDLKNQRDDITKKKEVQKEEPREQPKEAPVNTEQKDKAAEKSDKGREE
jgi:hypothetical protein